MIIPPVDASTRGSAEHDAEPTGLILINERAGTVVRTSRDEVTKRLHAGFTRLGHRLPQIEWAAPGAIGERLRQVVARGDVARLFVGGGDGTVATAAAALRDTETALAILPMGTFNLVARDLAIPLEIEEAAAALATAGASRIDCAEVNGHLYLCVCVLGFFPNLAVRLEQYRGLPWWRKSLGLVRAMFWSFRDYPSLRLRAEDANGPLPGVPSRTRFAAVANNAYRDEPGIIPVKESLEGGRLTVYLARHRTRLQLIRGSWAFVSGSLRRDRDFSIHHADSLVLTVRRKRRLRVMLDGEILRLTTPLRFRIHPASLRVIRPSPAAADAS